MGPLEHVDPVVARLARLGAHGATEVALVGRAHEALAHLRPAEQLGLGVERQGAQLGPLRQLVERQAGLERQQHGDAAAVRLGEHPPALGGGLVEQVELVAPDLRVGCAEHAERHRHAGVHRQAAQPAVGLGPRLWVACRDLRLVGQLEQPDAELAHRGHELLDLRPLGQARRHGEAVGGEVVGAARRGQADGPGVQGVAQLALHGRQVVGRRRLLERPRAHDERAQRRVADVRRVVDRLGQSVDRVEVAAVAVPRPRDAGGHGLAGDVLGALQVAHDELALRRRCGRQREAAVAHHHAGDAVVARAAADRVPEHLGVHVRVAVDEAGRDDEAVGVDLTLALLVDPADGGDGAAVDADIGAIARQPRTIDDRSAAHDEVVGHRYPRSICRA